MLAPSAGGPLRLPLRSVAAAGPAAGASRACPALRPGGPRPRPGSSHRPHAAAAYAAPGTLRRAGPPVAAAMGLSSPRRRPPACPAASSVRHHPPHARAARCFAAAQPIITRCSSRVIATYRTHLLRQRCCRSRCFTSVEGERRVAPLVLVDDDHAESSRRSWRGSGRSVRQVDLLARSGRSDDGKLQPLGAVDAHDPHDVLALGRDGRLAQVGLLPQAVEEPQEPAQPRRWNDANCVARS